MAQVSMTVRMDSQLKQMFDALCAQFGMSANTAMNVFAKAVVQRRSIPFEIKAEKAEEKVEKKADEMAKVRQQGMEAFYELRRMAENGEFPDMSLDEINEEIRLAREERRRRRG